MSIVICNKTTCEHNQGNACNKERIVVDNDGFCISRSLDLTSYNQDDEFIDNYDFKRCMR